MVFVGPGFKAFALVDATRFELVIAGVEPAEVAVTSMRPCTRVKKQKDPTDQDCSRWL